MNGAAISQTKTATPTPINVSEGDSTRESMAKVARWGTLIGVVLMVLGFASLLVPAATAFAIEIWLAAMFMFVGVSLLVQAFQNRGHGSVVFEIVWAVIYLLGGLTLLLLPKSGIITIALILAIVFITDGLGRIFFASKAFSNQRSGWWIADGVIAILLGGTILWFWPGDSAFVIGILVGLRLLIGGIVTFSVANFLRPRPQSPEAIS